MERFAIKILSRISAAGREPTSTKTSLYTSNISAGGAFYETTSDLSVGTQVKIVLHLPISKITNNLKKETKVETKGNVIRQATNGLAITFNGNPQFH